MCSVIAESVEPSPQKLGDYLPSTKYRGIEIPNYFMAHEIFFHFADYHLTGDVKWHYRVPSVWAEYTN